MSALKVALPGKDISSSDLQDFVLNSLAASPKINTKALPVHAGIIRVNWQSSNIAVALNTTRVLYSFPHGYNYVPTVFGVHHFDNGSFQTDGVLPFQYGGLGMLLIDADATNINLKYFSTDFSNTFPVTPFFMQVRFYVFAERGYEA